MARFYGEIGYGVTEETVPGVWEEKVTERPYYGDILAWRRRNEKGEGLNDNVAINNQFSIVADPYAFDNFQFMKYVKWNGVAWSITDVTVEYPRILVSVGGVYSGEQA